jgi:hypothetical protein
MSHLTKVLLQPANNAKTVRKGGDTIFKNFGGIRLDMPHKFHSVEKNLLKQDKTARPFFYIISIPTCNRQNNSGAIKIGISESEKPLERLWSYSRYYGPDLRLHLIKAFRGSYIVTENKRAGNTPDFKQYESSLKQILNKELKPNLQIDIKSRGFSQNEWFHKKDLPRILEIIDELDKGDFRVNVVEFKTRQTPRLYQANMIAKQNGLPLPYPNVNLGDNKSDKVILQGSKTPRLEYVKNRVKKVINYTFVEVKGLSYMDSKGNNRNYTRGDFDYDLGAGYIILKT